MFKKKINHKIIGASLLALCLSFNSCKDFTELDPLAELSETEAFNTPANIELAVNGMYWQAAVGRYDPGTGLTTGRGYPFGGASIEQGDMRGEDMVNLQAFYQITYQNNYTPTSANNVNHWEQLYALINQCNLIIEGVQGAIEQGVIEADAGNVYIGEAHLLRALAHHELLIHFCRPYADSPTSNLGVPYRTVAITTAERANENLMQERGTVAQAYEKLLEDLDTAEDLLPATRSNGIARATKGAAIALKTRVKLHQEDYPGVITEATKLGADVTSGEFSSSIGGYKLTSSPVDVFVGSFSSNTESIFSIAQSQNSNGGVNGAITSMFSPANLNGRDLIAVSPNLYNADFWLADDIRKTELTFDQTAPDEDGEYGDFPYIYSYKYRRYGINDDWNPIIRYAEVLLNAAEAYAYTGNDPQALRLLNAVRDRSVGADNSYGTTAPADLKLAIYNERRIEFLAEGRRWADIHRLALKPNYGGGIPAKVRETQMGPDDYDGSTMLTPSQPALPYSDHRFVWPLPQSELNANPTLRAEQNPNY